MPVHRLSEKNLFQILNGDTLKRRAICIIKFYSNGCHYCHSLRGDFHDIADLHADNNNMYFFAFNIDDLDSDRDLPIKINGVPTICKVKTGPIPIVNTLMDPPSPHKEKWYYKEEIEKFVTQKVVG